MANALVIRKSHFPSRRNTFLAAQYVRMSTDKQRYSIQNQAAVIAAYAHAHNLQIVKTYRDEGESGLLIKNRCGLQELIADVSGGHADFGYVLVYDVSRWGRFQDTDEGAHYEFVCKRAGVKVAYCAEQFDNDGSMLSSIVKNLKRVMAAEYSRDLSKRVHAGQSNVVRLGFRHGAPIAYGFRRELVDQNRKAKVILKKGEHKALITDRVRMVLGTSDEIEIVRWIFEQCLKQRPDTDIVRELNRKSVPSSTGRPWTPIMVSTILKNENYIGNIVYNRRSRKLRTPIVNNPPALWIRGDSGVEPIVTPDVFHKAKKRIEDRRVEIPEGEMLSRLRRVLHKKGRLTPAIIDNTPGLPGIHSYIRHFGSVREVYRLIGYTSERDYKFIDATQAWAQVAKEFIASVSAQLEDSGRHVVIGENDIFIDQTFRVLFRVARATPSDSRLTQWRLPHIQKPASRWIIAIRLDDDNEKVMDYVLIPTGPMNKKYPDGYMRFTDMAFQRLGFEGLKSVKAVARRIGSLLR